MQRSEGLPAFYRGLTPSMIGILPYAGETPELVEALPAGLLTARTAYTGRSSPNKL